MKLRTAPASDAQLELFSAIFTDIVPRDVRESMDMPFLSLSKQPRFKPIHYAAKGVEVTVTGGEPYGIANIWDWDLMMWLMSQIRHSIDRGQGASRKVRFHRHVFLKEVRRAYGGSQYRRLEDSIARLKNTNIVTTIRAKSRRTVMFSWVEYAEIERDANGDMAEAIVVLPEWLYEAVANKSLILSLHPDYFLLTGGLARWLYKFVRKGAGRNHGGWKWKMRTLHERSGSTQDYKYFAREIRQIVTEGKLLDYEVRCFEEGEEGYLAARRSGGTRASVVREPEVREAAQCLALKTTTYEKAKRVAPGYDVYCLEAEWRDSTLKKGVWLRNPDSAFVAWCSTVSQRRPLLR